MYFFYLVTVTFIFFFKPLDVLTIIVAFPMPFAVILPDLFTVATFLFVDVHVSLSVVVLGVNCVVIFFVLPTFIDNFFSDTFSLVEGIFIENLIL